MFPRTEATIFVRGLDAAAALVAAARADDAADGDVVGPVAARTGWWSVRVTTGGGLAELLPAAGDGPAIALQGEGAPVALLTVLDKDGVITLIAGGRDEFSFPDESDPDLDAARLVSWSEATPRRLSKLVARR